MQHPDPERLTPPLSGGHPPVPGPQAVLGLPRDATRGEARRAFRRLARQTHPDAGGDVAAFRAVAGAWAELAAVLPAEPSPPPRSWPSPHVRAYRPVPGRVIWAEPRPAPAPVRRPDFASVLDAELARLAA
jgi:molecular chaperone DnaJ